MMNGQRAPVVKDRHIMQENIYATLRGQICWLERAPGSIMSASEIAASMTILMERTVSRTPVREAFLQLEKEGLVSMMPQYGTVVTKIDRERAKEERQLRYLLEPENINSVVERATEDDYRQLRELIEQQEKMIEQYLNLQYFALDDKFHHDQFLIGGHPLFLEILKTRNSHYDRMRTMTTWDINNVKNSIRQHVELVNALEKKKAEEAKQILQDHLCKLIDEEGDLFRQYPEYFTVLQS